MPFLTQAGKYPIGLYLRAGGVASACGTAGRHRDDSRVCGLLFGSDPSFRLSAGRGTLPRSGDAGDRRSRSRGLDAGRKAGAFALSILAYFGGR
jgi:hypothetical protein